MICWIFLEINFVKLGFGWDELLALLYDLGGVKVFCCCIRLKIRVLFINMSQKIRHFLIRVCSRTPQTITNPAKITRFIQVLCVRKLLTGHWILHYKVIK